MSFAPACVVAVAAPACALALPSKCEADRDAYGRRSRYTQPGSTRTDVRAIRARPAPVRRRGSLLGRPQGAAQARGSRPNPQFPVHGPVMERRSRAVRKAPERHDAARQTAPALFLA